MLDHHLQRSIVYRLALVNELRFSDLKPDDVENKLFTYHLKKAVSAGFVQKTEAGFYKLTPDGRRLGAHVLDHTEDMVDRAYSVLFLVIRREADGAWLLYKRKTHPLLNRFGFMHCTPNAEEDISQTAGRICLEKTGLCGVFKPLGSGFFRIYEGERLESFTNFTLLGCEDAAGTLAPNDTHAEYFWAATLDPSDPNLLPNMPALIEKYQQPDYFFLEKKITI